jgi:hypothetical protein
MSLYLIYTISLIAPFPRVDKSGNNILEASLSSEICKPRNFEVVILTEQRFLYVATSLFKMTVILLLMILQDFKLRQHTSIVHKSDRLGY